MQKIFLFVFFFQISFCQNIPENVKRLMVFYPQIIEFKENKLFFKDGSSLIYDDKKNKTIIEKLESPDIEDQFFYSYSLIKINDAGRIRNEDFFKKIYGNTSASVEANLIDIIWCPQLVNQKIRITKINGLDKIVKKLSAELDKNVQFAKYISKIGGTFKWRNIAGTTRLSAHSFGMTIDINTKFSNYWQWDCNCKSENAKLSYRNRIPIELVKIFEKYGFIWGGNWLHYDTMHFEYRPELL